MHPSKNRRFFIILAALFCLSLPVSAQTEDKTPPLPPAVQTHAATPLEPVGSGAYRKFGMRIYNVTLWAKNKAWDPRKPYALQLCYTHGVSKDTMVDTVMDDIRDQNVADDNTLARWQAMLTQTLPPVEDGDVLIGLAQPGKKSQLFYNGKQIASIGDAALSKAFFDVWLGPTADEDMRNGLLGRSDQ